MANLIDLLNSGLINVSYLEKQTGLKDSTLRKAKSTGKLSHEIETKVIKYLESVFNMSEISKPALIQDNSVLKDEKGRKYKIVITDGIKRREYIKE